MIMKWLNFRFRSGFSVSTGSPLSSYAPGYRTCSSEGSPQPGPSGYQKKSGADKGYGTSTATQPIEDSDDYLSGSHSAHKLRKSSKLSCGKKRKSGSKKAWSEEKGRCTTTATQPTEDSDDSQSGSSKLSSSIKKKFGTKKVLSDEKGCNISTKNPAFKLQVSSLRTGSAEYFPYSPDNKSFSPDYSPSPVGSPSPSPGPHDDDSFSPSWFSEQLFLFYSYSFSTMYLLCSSSKHSIFLT